MTLATRGFAVALGAAMSVACGDPNAPASDASTSDGEFIAFERDFARFQRWPSTDLGVAMDESVHLSGGRVTYVNKRPGSVVAPKGTIVVKISGVGTATRRVFAMAKRGGTYNADGAKGWEWFELEDGTETPKIVWRGLGAPDGETYVGGSECNTCHSAGVETDYVLGPELR